MTTWNPQANQLFLQALQLRCPGERREYLDSACGGDVALRAEVEALLHASDQAGSFLEPSAPAPHLLATIDDPIRERPGTLIGPYKLLEEIGEGGMGIVFMAEQQQPLRRKVALKVLKPGMDTRQIVARFEAERQALALMDHPNIAHIFDGGQTDAGRPYFVMELVKGIPITDFCDRNNLSIRDRLELFATVCQAVQHAHQKGVIHRDLKPSNVLVMLHDTTPVVKIIDFGIAKAIGQQLTEKTLFTGFAQMIGTPLYMSPEQAGQSGLDVDTRSDIYSLGVLLYELLTGLTPFDRERLRTVGFDEIRRIIREEEPAKPSTRISTLGQAATTVSTQRQSDPRRLSQLLRGELDWIVMKALEKDRNRRYESAIALAADVQRYLHDEPVLACPPSLRYRFGKFARRNKAGLAIVSAIAFFLAVGIIGLAVSYVLVAREKQKAVSEKERADQNLALAKKAVIDYLAATANDSRLKGADLQNLRKNLLATAAPFFEAFARQKADDPQLEAERGQALCQLAFIREEMGETEKAREEYERARVLFTDLAAAHPDVPKYRQDLAICHYNLGNIRSTFGQPDAAEAEYREALAILERLVAERPEESAYQQHLAAAYNNLGTLFSGQNKHAEAGQAYRQSAAIVEKLVAAFPANGHYRESLASSRTNQANQLCELGQSEEALRLYRQALTIRADLVKTHPGNREYRDGLAQTHNNLGALLETLNRPAESEAEYQKALSLWGQLSADFRSVPEYRHRLAMSYFNRGRLLIKRKGQPIEAIAAYRQAVGILRTLVRDFPRNPEYRVHLGTDCNTLGRLLLANRQPAEAETAFRTAIAAQETLVTDYPQVALHAVALAGNYVNLGIAFSEKGQFQVAVEWYSKAIAALEPLCRRKSPPANAAWFLRNAFSNRARTLVHLKRYREALPDWDRSIELSAERERGPYRLGRLEALARSGQHIQAAKEADALAAAPNAPAGTLYDLACFYSVSAAAAGADAERAERYATRAVALLRRAIAAGYKNLAHMRKDSDLDPLRANEEFKKLLRELETASKP